jgi:hypothetical protein
MGRRLWAVTLLMATSGATMAARLTVDINAMPRLVFTGDSQTCGCVGAMDYAQMISPQVPLRIFNRAVGGSNTAHLLSEFGGGKATVRAGERVVHGEDVGWFAGPYIGQTVRLGAQEYTVDSIETTDYAKRRANLYLTEPAREDFSGTDYRFEAGWRVRVAEVHPRYACFMFTVNDAAAKPGDFKARLVEITRRCREAAIQPIFLSGVPFMDAESGGSHAGAVSHTAQRARDLLEFCTQEKLPYGDVYQTLDLLDAQRTSVWADTIHPTNDGSVLIVHALRSLLTQMGAMGNPYHVHGFRCPDAILPEPTDAGLVPITTAQPRRDRNNRLDQAGHNLEAQRIRDEYGLLAAADGQALESATPLLLRVGVGDAAKVDSATAEVVLAEPGEVLAYSYTRSAWVPIAQGEGALAAPLSALPELVHDGAVWLAVRGEKVAVDYAAVHLTGDLAPWEPPKCERPILWPEPGEFDWVPEMNLLPNGDLTSADGEAPAGWTAQGADARYLPAGIVADGTGEFCGPRGDQFRCVGAKFTRTVRALDMLVVKAEVAGGRNFLVQRVLDDETLSLRRAPEVPPGMTGFEVRRRSGLRAVPGDACVEVAEGSTWRTTVRLGPGKYRIGFFYRCFAPEAMNAQHVASGHASVALRQGDAGPETRIGQGLDSSYVWLRGWGEITMTRDGALTLEASAQGPERVQYTGWSVHRH